ncbi:SMP-30/gluconolactonase/LRE family protein [Planktotalea arctica]|uniref:SMP-30/gluconolactonase/LRE family protein n=1 Tax=Planktotalea arctica TaxID=1481893 RepID=UPI00321A31C6
MIDSPTKARSATLAKGLDIMNFLGSTSEPQSLRQVMASLEMTKPTAHRLLATLADHGMVRFDSSDNTYRLGMRLFELSRQVWQEFDLRGSATTEMQKLHAATGETISLAILTPDGGVYIDELQSKHHLREQSRVGQRVSMWRSAIGQALVSGLSFAERMQLQKEHKSDILLDDRYSNLLDLNRHLDLVNARGYAIDLDADVQGISGVAAPIVDHRGVTVAAIGLSGSSQRLDREALHRIGPAVIEATRLASLQAGGAPRPVSSVAMPAYLPPPEYQILANVSNLIGEGPVRSFDGQSILWVDICRPCIFSYHLATGSISHFPQNEMITAISDTERGLLVAGLSGVRIIDLETATIIQTLCDPEAVIPTNRYNDGKCDRRGRFWLGSLAFNLELGAGSLYRIDPDGTCQKVESRLSLPNGLGWSTDNRKMYLIDTADRVVYAYDFDIDTGAISNRQNLIKFDSDSLGSPDGMDVDADGNLWIAMWDGWSVRKYAPDGALLAVHSVPFPRPTSCLCLGEGFDQVIVTSARIRVSSDLLRDHPLAGDVISLSST